MSSARKSRRAEKSTDEEDEDEERAEAGSWAEGLAKGHIFYLLKGTVQPIVRGGGKLHTNR